jgi:GR25 family glycosyltransferase involved in LPS biosynthesis
MNNSTVYIYTANDNNIVEKYYYDEYMSHIKHIPLYFINLDRSKDRLTYLNESISKTNTELKTHNISIKPIRISAVDGKDKKNIDNIVIKYPKTQQTNYELACTFSHLQTIKRAYDDKCEYAIISEDDMDITYFGKYYNIFINIMKNANKFIDIIQLYTIQPPQENKNIYTNDIPLIKWKHDNWSTGMYIINKNGMKKIINKFYSNNKININSTIKSLTAENIIYTYVNTYTSTIPFAIDNMTTNSLIRNDLPECHYISVKKALQKLTYIQNKTDVIKSFYNNKKECIFNGKYLLFVSMGDNSNDAYNTWLPMLENSDIDFVVYYYGDNDELYNRLSKNCTLIVRSKGLKFDNFYKFYWTYYTEIINSKYEYVGIFDDDIILKGGDNPLLTLFHISSKYNSYISGPSCHRHTPGHQVSYWKATIHRANTLFHYVNMIETNTPIIRIDKVHYLMSLYNYQQIPSWGSDLWYIQILGKNKINKYMIIDIVQYINPTINIKKVKNREIEIYENTGKNIWLLYAKNKNLDITLPNNIIYTYIKK